jgi:hypothetical protein
MVGTLKAYQTHRVQFQDPRFSASLKFLSFQIENYNFGQLCINYKPNYSQLTVFMIIISIRILHKRSKPVKTT